jgi:iron complex outermembrane recepter protein
MRKATILSTSALRSAAFLGFTALMASQAAGQVAPTPVPAPADPCLAPATAAEAANCPLIEEALGTSAIESSADITVVGSRIRRNEFNTADPIQIITRDEATQAGFNSTAEILQSTAVTGGTPQINDTFGGFVVAGGPGVNTLSLRGLGTTRTLILLNGRRVAPAGSRGSVGTTDLNVLPSAIIDRIEILNTGASSIYGSDAVAGVVNIVTNDRVRGLTLEAQHNVPEVGAGGSRRYSLVAGTSGERFSLLGSVEYYKRDALRMRDREFSRCPRQLYLSGIGTEPGSGDYIDPATGQPKCWPIDGGGVTVNTIATDILSGDSVTLANGFAPPPDGYLTFCNRFRPRAGAGGALPGYECVGGVYFNPSTDHQIGVNLNLRDTFAGSMLQEDLISPVEIYTGFLRGSYETGILGDAELYTEILVNRRNSSQDQQRQFFIDYPIDSPLLSPELRAVPVGSGIGIRAFTDFGIYNNRQTVDFAKLAGGLRGNLPFNWRYDAYLSKSWSDSEYTSDLILSDRLAQSLNVVQNPDGSFQCSVTTGGCVAAPVLTGDIVGGRYRDTAWFDYIVDPVTGVTKYRETTFNLTLDGPVVRLPGGNLGAALGVEYRRANIDDTPSPESVRGNLYGFTSSTPTRGRDAVWEVFGEVDVPILSNVPFADILSLNGSLRYTEYQSYGGQWTYKIGGLYAPIRGLSFRGSYGTSYRAPALFEQFQGATSGFSSNQNDPCHNLVDVTNPLIRERCLADGLPETFIQTSSITVIGLGGAEAGLEAETSTALTFGGVLQPRLGSAFGDLSLAVDYFDVKIDNGVAQLSATNILAQCYNNPQRTTCPLVTRAPYTGPGSGGLTVIQSYVNISDARAEGIDYTLRYVRDLGPGRLRLGASLTQMLSRYSRQVPTSDIVELVGRIAQPKWSGTFDAAYSMEGWTFRYGVDWIQGTSDNAYLEQFGWDPAEYHYTLPDYFLHTASIRYDTDSFGISLGVRNLLDKDPPQITIENPLVNTVANVPLQSGFDMRGRTFFINTRFRF